MRTECKNRLKLKRIRSNGVQTGNSRDPKDQLTRLTYGLTIPKCSRPHFLEVYIAQFSKILTVLLICPRHYNDTGNSRLPAKVYHPDWCFDVEVVEDGAAVDRRVRSAIDRPGRLCVDPLALHVSLVLGLPAVDKRLLAIGEVLHCNDDRLKCYVIRRTVEMREQH